MAGIAPGPDGPEEPILGDEQTLREGPALGPARMLGPTEIRTLAARLGVQPSKRLGQNFVIDAGTVRRITAMAGVRDDDTVLEVGPGFGSLTLPLLAAARRVVAIEVDAVLAAELPLTVAARAPELAGRLEVVTADAARVTGLPGAPPTVLVANLPYNVSVPVVLHLLSTVPSLRGGVVMVQAEVADRMCAPPGSRTYGVPSAKVAWFATARRAGSVGRAVFWPVPRVDSGLVEIVRLTDDEAARVRGAAGQAETFAVIEAAFSQRRKTLRSALAAWAGSPVAAEDALRAAGVDPSLRGEALGVADFARIAVAGGVQRGAGAAQRGKRRGCTPRWRRGCTARWHRGCCRPERYDHQIVISAIRPAPVAVTVRVPAKVNLQLAVGPVRADGYHSLVTVFHAVSLFDEVTAAAADKTAIAVTGEDAAAVPTDRANLAWQAASALAKAAGLRGAAVRIEIRKRIPVAAGLAGGSADAAATLVACNELWQTGLSARDLAGLAASLGSDVPFALVGGTAVGPRPRRAPHAGACRRHLPLGAGIRSRRTVDGSGLCHL